MKKFKPDLFLIAGAEGMGHHALRDVLSDFLNRDDVMWFRYGSSPYFNIIPGVKTSLGIVLKLIGMVHTRIHG